MLGARAIVAALGWSGTVLISHALPDAAAFGSFAFVFALLGILGMVADFETTRVVIAEIDEWDDLDELAGRFFVFRVGLSTIVYVLALAIVIVGPYSSIEVQAVALGGMSYFIASGLWSLISICQAKLWLRSVAIALVAGQVVQFAIILGLAIADRGSLLRFVIPAVVNDAVTLVVLMVLLRGVVRPRPRVDVERWRRWFRAAAPLALGTFIGNLYFRLDIVMLTWLLPRVESREEVAIYQVGYKFSDLLAFVAPALLAAVLPMLVRTRGTVGFLATFRQAVVIVSIVVAFAVPVFAVLARPVIEAFFPDDLAGAAGPARWLVIGQALNFATQLVFVTLVATERRARYPIATSAGLLVNIALNVVLVPEHGAMGAAVATIITEIVVLAVLATALRGLPVFPLPGASLLRVGAAGLASAITAVAVSAAAPWFVAGAAATIVFVGILQATGVDGPGGLVGFAERSRRHVESI